MSDLTQAAEQALLVLRSLPPTDKTSIYSKAIYALEKALEANEQSLITEPVAYCKLIPLRNGPIFQRAEVTWLDDKLPVEGFLYTAPPEKQTLTDDELKAFIDEKYKKTIFMPSAADKFSLGWYKKGFRDGESYTKENT